MSYIDRLLDAYRREVSLPWPDNLASPQRIWMLVYTPDQERRVRLHVPDFEIATKDQKYKWHLIDITTAFERWMAAHEYRESYFESPELMEPAMSDFFDQLVSEVKTGLSADEVDENTVVALLGAGMLFGLGDGIKVSALLNEVSDSVKGRLLVFFPGRHEGNSYRLLDARDGWNYLATPITVDGGAR